MHIGKQGLDAQIGPVVFFVCGVEFVKLVVFLDVRLDDSRAGDVFLHDAVDAVKLFLNDGEKRRRFFHKEDHEQNDDRERAGDYEREGRSLHIEHEDTAEEHRPGSDETADGHHDRRLDLTDVVAESRDERARRKFVGLLEGKPHYFFEKLFAEIVAEVLRGEVGENAGKNAAARAEKNEEYHLDPGRNDDVDVFAENAVVDYSRHKVRLQKIHPDLAEHEDRRKKAPFAVFFE